jgi:hypothetical protein
LAAISHVFTITYVAEMLGEDAHWLHELSIYGWLPAGLAEDLVAALQ